MFAAETHLFTANNRGYRYGDGFFETMRVVNGQLPLLQYHLERLEFSFELLQYKRPSTSIKEIFDQALALCEKNNCLQNARVRLSFSNGEGSVFNTPVPMDYLIEATALNDSYNRLNEEELIIGVSPHAKKSCDAYANLKSANYLIYRIAADQATKNNWNDTVVVNVHDRISETSVANIFWIKGENIFTPPLSEGCVKGTMRSYLLEKLAESGFNIAEKKCLQDDLFNADEIFLTNAVSGSRWVKQLNDKRYGNSVSKKIYALLIAPLWAS